MAQSEPVPIPPRRSHGCLWSCLIAVVLLCAGAGGVVYYAGVPVLALYQGLKNDPSLKLAMDVVRSDRVARDVLGNDIRIEAVESESFTALTGNGRTAAYTAQLRGDKAEGQLHVTFHSSGDRMKIVSIVLTGPDGERYNLTDTKPAETPPGSI